MPQPKQALAAWITKEQAAKLLGVNTRQVQKRAEQGYIEKRFLPRLPHERQSRVTYARADVEAILAGSPNHYGEAVSDKADIPAPPGNVTKDLARIREFIGAAHAVPAPPPEKPWIAYVGKQWLSLDEAAEYSGLPAAFVADLVRGGQVVHVGRGPKTWRIRRESLDAWRPK